MACKLLLIIFLNVIMQSQSYNITIGGLLKNEESIRFFREKFDNYSNEDIKFNTVAQVLSKNALKSTDQMCEVMMNSMAIIIEQEEQNLTRRATYFDTNADAVMTATLTGVYSNLQVIAVNTRDSIMTDRLLYTNLLRVVPPYSQQAVLMAALVEQFGWNQIVAIYCDDEESRSMLAHFEIASNNKKLFKVEQALEIVVTEEILDEWVPFNLTDTLSTLASTQYRAFVLFSNSFVAEEVFRVCVTLGLFRENFAWLISEQASLARNTPQGVITSRISPEQSQPFLEDAIDLVAETFRTKLKEFSNSYESFEGFSDCKDYPKLSKGNWFTYAADIRTAFLQQHMSGTGSKAYFLNNAGERKFISYHVLNMRYDNKWKSVGYVKSSYDEVNALKLNSIHDQRSAFNKLLDLNITKIIWPSNSTYHDNSSASATAPKSFQKKTFLSVVTIRSIPFVYTRKVGAVPCKTSDNPTVLNSEVNCTHTNPKTGKTEQLCCQGYCVDLLRHLSDYRDIDPNSTTFKFSLHLVSDGKAGDEININGTNYWNGVINELIKGEADLSVAPLTITPDRATVVDFTKPYKYLGFTILVKKTETHSALNSFLQPFHIYLWILVGLAVHIVALILYLLDRFSPFGRFKLSKTSDTEEDALNLSSAMWFAWGVLLNSGIGEGTPRSFSARVLGMVWAGFAMIIVASYTANLAAFLVLDRPEASITGIDDARLRNPMGDYIFATVKKSPVEDYFKRQVEYATMYRAMEKYNYDTLDEAIEAVKSEKLNAFIWDSARLTFEASSNCDLMTVGEIFGRTGYGLALKKGNSLLNELSRAILSFHERGIMEKLDKNWILLDHCSSVDSSPATLGLQNMKGVFAMVAVGIGLGIILIFIEIAYKKRRGTREKELDIAKSAADRWRANIAKRKIYMKKQENSIGALSKRVTIEEDRDIEASEPAPYSDIYANTNSHTEDNGYPNQAFDATEISHI